MSNYSGIAGRRVLITGATSGLGLAMARALVKEGAKVLITGRDQNKIDQAVSSIRSATDPTIRETPASLSGECVGALIDVRDEQSIEKGLAGMVQHWGGIDVLINNAGIGMQTVNPRFLTDPKPFWEISSSGFRDLIDTNLTGYFLVAKAVVPYFLKAGSGKIINIGVTEGTKKRKGFVPYGPSRAATESLSHIMAQDLAEYGVTVNLLQPGGATETGMVPEEFRVKMGAQLLRPEVMAEPVLFLCADEANGLNDEQIVAKDFQEWKTNKAHLP
jgi:NAD(P)-dependent dehydrogenase (short-subunit alcohol dehydrogenase family)